MKNDRDLSKANYREALEKEPSKTRDKNDNSQLIGRTFWDFVVGLIKSKYFLALALTFIALLLMLVSLGLIEIRFQNENFEFRTAPLAGVKGDPVHLQIGSLEKAKLIKQVFIPTFTDTIVNYGGSTDGDYLEGITQLFSAKLSSLYETKVLQVDSNRPYGFKSALNATSGLEKDRLFGVLVGSVHKYQDERPDIGQKAILAITIQLFDQGGTQVWVTSQTTSAKSEDAENDHLDGVEAIELLERMSTEMVRQLSSSINK